MYKRKKEASQHEREPPKTKKVKEDVRKRQPKNVYYCCCMSMETSRKKTLFPAGACPVFSCLSLVVCTWSGFLCLSSFSQQEGSQIPSFLDLVVASEVPCLLRSRGDLRQHAAQVSPRARLGAPPLPVGGGALQYPSAPYMCSLVLGRR